MFYAGIGLIYIGFESYVKSVYPAPTNIHVHDNIVSYPVGAIDSGAAIYLYAPRSVIVEDNRIINNSQSVVASAVHILPAAFSEGWVDPSGLDPANVARVWGADILRNKSEGTFPLDMKMTGNCVDYQGPVNVHANRARKYTFYCERVSEAQNQLSP